METTRPIHKATFCNGCKTPVITGKRYKCGNCLDYNLCGICIDYNPHNSDHAFVILIKPLNDSLERTKLLNHRLFVTTSDFGLSFGDPSWCGAMETEPPRLDNKSGPLFDSIVRSEEPRPNPFHFGNAVNMTFKAPSFDTTSKFSF